MLTNKMETFELFHSKGVVKSARECSRNLGQRSILARKGTFLWKRALFMKKGTKSFTNPPACYINFSVSKLMMKLKLEEEHLHLKLWSICNISWVRFIFLCFLLIYYHQYCLVSVIVLFVTLDCWSLHWGKTN